MQLAIEALGLRKLYGDTAVLRGIDLAVPRGTLFALLGPNGAGKTTLIRILATLLQPDGGTARIEGHDVEREPRAVRGLIGLTGQYASVDELLTGEENLIMLGELLHIGKAAATQRAAELLERFELTDAANRRAQTYSGGMRRRIDLAASLMATPPVVFLDEPTTGLDPRSRRALWEVIRGLVADGTSILLTTQYLEEADQLADRIAVLNNGQIVTEGTPRELKTRVGQERLTLTISDPAELCRAGDLLHAEPHQLNGEARTLSLTLAETDQLRSTLNLLADAQVRVADVALSEPTLDDVFFAVTATSGMGD